MIETVKDWVGEIVALILAFIIGTAAVAQTQISACGGQTHAESKSISSEVTPSQE